METRSARQRRGTAMDDASAGTDLEQNGGKRSGSGAPAPAHASDASDEPFSLDGDRGALALLLLLYTLQGVPMGLASSVSFVLQERGGSYADQGALRREAPQRRRSANASPWVHIWAHDMPSTRLGVAGCAVGSAALTRAGVGGLRLRRLQLRVVALLAQDPVGAAGGLALPALRRPAPHLAAARAGACCAPPSRRLFCLRFARGALTRRPRRARRRWWACYCSAWAARCRRCWTATASVATARRAFGR